MGTVGDRRCLGWSLLWLGPRGGRGVVHRPAQGVWGAIPTCEHCHSLRHLAQQGLSLLAGLVQAAGGHSWRWQCVSPDCRAEGRAEQGGEAGGSSGRGRSSGANLGCSLVHPQSAGDEHGATLLPPVLPKAWHTHHTPAQNTLHLSEGGHRGVPALVVEVPAAPKAARPWPICLHGVSQLWDTLLRGCRKGH